jgi:tRNA pseudouridine55 synthase
VAEYLVAGRKRYRAVIHLGVSTDSHDADGQVTGTAPLRSSRAEVEAALTHFCGAIQQVPPMVSAIKRDGQPLYKLARRGITIARTARPVEIYQLTLTDWSPPHLTLELTSSPGTYVRALARDLGQHLGCGAHLSALTRLSSGNFKLEQAINLEQFAAAVAEGNWRHLILPIDAGLGHFPVCTLDAQESRRVRSGQSLAARLISAPKDQLCRAYATHGDEKRLLALLKFDHDTHSWRPHKVFHPL